MKRIGKLNGQSNPNFIVAFAAFSGKNPAKTDKNDGLCFHLQSSHKNFVLLILHLIVSLSSGPKTYLNAKINHA